VGITTTDPNEGMSAGLSVEESKKQGWCVVHSEWAVVSTLVRIRELKAGKTKTNGATFKLY
jgi:hypothetical protein